MKMNAPAETLLPKKSLSKSTGEIRNEMKIMTSIYFFGILNTDLTNKNTILTCANIFFFFRNTIFLRLEVI